MTTTMTEREAQRAGIGGKKRRKYGNKPCEMDGYKFDSLAEMKRYGELKQLHRAGKISSLVADKKNLRFNLSANSVHVGIYVADFIYKARGIWVVEDVKSSATKTRVYKMKKALMLACHGIEIQEIG